VCFYVKAGSRPNSILDQSFELVVVTKIQWDFGRIALLTIIGYNFIDFSDSIFINYESRVTLNCFNPAVDN